MRCPHCGEYIEEESKGFWDKVADSFSKPCLTITRGVCPDKVVHQNILIINKDNIKDPKLLKALEQYSD